MHRTYNNNNSLIQQEIFYMDYMTSLGTVKNYILKDIIHPDISKPM